MESRSLNQSPGDPYVGDVSFERSSQRLRKKLQAIFEHPCLQRADGFDSQRSDLRASLRQVCADARHSAIRAEQLLVLIKDVWSSLPPGISRVTSVHGDERLTYVISTCVDEYYGHVSRDDEGSP